MPIAPIWKDRRVTLAASGEYADFEIHLDGASGTLIYSGRAHPRPGETSITARINDICADYIAAVLPALEQGMTRMQCAMTFVTVVGGTAVDTVTFYNDWSYDSSFTPGDLAHPVNYEVDPRQWLFFTVLPGTSTLAAELLFRDGTTTTVPLTIYASGDFNGDFNNDFNIAAAGTGGTAVLDLSTYQDHGGLISVTISQTTYRVARKCRDYALFYVNAYGGWDSLVLDGHASLRDDLEHYTMQMDYDNSEASARGRKDYAIEVTPAWTLRTGILDDVQSLRMHNPLNSPEAYLCELSSGRFFPVLLTDTVTDRKTYKGNGRQMNTYTFNASLAQQRYRR